MSAVASGSGRATGGARRGTAAVRVVGALIGAALVASVLNTVVAVVTRAAGASDAFEPLDAKAYVPLTVFGVVLASIGWALLRRLANAELVLKVLVPLVLVVSWVPDILLGLDGTRVGVSWTGVVGLMVMHAVVAAVLVPVLVRFLPPRVRPSA